MKQRIMISIDVEAPLGSDGVDNLIYCKTASGEYGINFLMDCFDKYGYKGLFFVDVAEAWEYGQEPIEKVIKHIVSRGHEVGVHLHPDRMGDKDRKFLWQYSYDEQYEMIKKCTDFYRRAVGKFPKSFRAGRYGADDNTVKALASLGYEIDMSYFYRRKTCRISKQESINGLFQMEGLIEVPVTSYKSFQFFKYVRHDKLDFSMPFSEFQHVLKKAKKENSVAICSFFLHSFSLVNWRKDPDHPKANKSAIKKLLRELEYISSCDSFDVVTEEDVSGIYNEVSHDSATKTLLDLSKNPTSLLYFTIRAISTIKDRLERNI